MVIPWFRNIRHSEILLSVSYLRAEIMVILSFDFLDLKDKAPLSSIVEIKFPFAFQLVTGDR